MDFLEEKITFYYFLVTIPALPFLINSKKCSPRVRKKNKNIIVQVYWMFGDSFGGTHQSFIWRNQNYGHLERCHIWCISGAIPP